MGCDQNQLITGWVWVGLANGVGHIANSSWGSLLDLRKEKKNRARTKKGATKMVLNLGLGSASVWLAASHRSLSVSVWFVASYRSLENLCSVVWLCGRGLKQCTNHLKDQIRI